MYDNFITCMKSPSETPEQIDRYFNVIQNAVFMSGKGPDNA